jgi:hypothetical protein
MTTTVLTLTLTGLAADSGLAGGSNPRAGRRTAAVLTMLAGAFAGAEMYLHRGAALPLAISAGVAGLAAITVLAGPAASHLDKE